MVLLVPVALPLAAFAADSDAGASSRAGEAWINGTVSDFATGMLEAIEGASVTATNTTAPFDSFDTTTDANGLYSLDVEENGTYNVSVSHADYETNMSTDVVADEGAPAVADLGLVRLPSMLWGLVFDGTSGMPVAGVTVSVEEFNTSSGQQEMRTDSTDASGQFTLSGLRGGVGLDLWASAPRYLSAVVSSLGDIGPNQTRQQGNISLDRQGGTLTVTVTDLDGAPLSGALITLSSAYESTSDVTNDTGVFSIGVPWGEYTLSVNVEGYFGHSQSLSVVEGQPTPLDVMLEPTPDLTAMVDGRVRDSATSKGIVGASVTFWDQDRPGKQLGTTTVAGGAYSLDIYAGFFRAVAAAPGYRADVRFVTLSDGQQLPLEHLLQALTLDRSIGGNVTRGGAGLPGAMVELLEGDVRLSSAITDASGDFTLGALAGELTLMVTADDHFDHSQTVTVGGTNITGLSIALLPIPPTTVLVEGYLRSGAGLSIVGGTLTLTDLDSTHGGHTISSASNTGGYFALWTYPGEFVLTADADGVQGTVQELILTTSTDLGDLVLAPSPPNGEQTTVQWQDFVNLTLQVETITEADASLTRWTIDRDFGAGPDLDVSADEVTAYEASLRSRGPPIKDSTDLLELDGQGYLVNGTAFDVNVTGATGSVLDAGAVTVTWGASYRLDGTADGQTHLVTYRIDFDDAQAQRSAGLTLPVGLQVRDLDFDDSTVTSLDTAPTVTIDGTVDANVSATSEVVSFVAFPNEAPVADGGGDRVVKPDVATQFDGRGSTDDQGVVNYTWDIGGLDMFYGDKITYNFSLPAGSSSHRLVMTLTVRDNGGLTNSTEVNVTIDGQAPLASFEVFDAAGAPASAVDEDDANLTFRSTSNDNVGVFNLSWDFGDNDIDFGAEVNHSWSQPGSYVVTLTVLDEAGHETEVNRTITVLDTTAPDAAFNSNTVSQATVGDAVTFNCSGSADNGGDEALTCNWNFGDNTTTVDGTEVNHTFATPGVYEVKLTVTDAAGNGDMAYRNISILDKRKSIDLVPINLKFSVKEPKVGQEVSVTVTVKNQGKDASPDFVVRLYDGPKTVKDKTQTSLAGNNATVTVKFTWKPTSEGDHTIKVTVNPGNEFPEDDMGNQTTTDSVKVVADPTFQYIAIAVIAALIVIPVVGLYLSNRAKRARRKRRKDR